MNPPQLPTGTIPAPQRCGLALASLILGICSFALCLGPLAGIPAVICGHMAFSRIKQVGGALTGSGVATAGLITGYLSIALIPLIGLLASIAIPNFVRARQQAQYMACQSSLKSIQASKEVWALEKRKGNYDVPVDADLFGESKGLAQKPACPAGGTYRLNAVENSPTCSVHGGIAR
jgi:predicted lipid-binding transport protein (Tim44 family)